MDFAVEDDVRQCQTCVVEADIAWNVACFASNSLEWYGVGIQRKSAHEGLLLRIVA
jgi:hypothetical protein